MSTLEVSNLNDGTTTVATTNLTNGSAKVYVRYIQTSTTINQSFNVSSVTDSATGDSEVNYTNSFDAIEYPIPANNSYTSSGLGVWSRMDFVTNNGVLTKNSSGSAEDAAYNLVGIGNLA
jgi:hypothetical protein